MTMADMPWLKTIRNEIDDSTLDIASQSINIDGIVNELCIPQFVWRYHSDFEAWIYASRKVHTIVIYLVEMYIYRVASQFANTFCISETAIEGVALHEWSCVYSKVPKPLGVVKPLRKNSSSDLSTIMAKLRQRRRSNSLSIW
jgi:hypothetical protein